MNYFKQIAKIFSFLFSFALLSLPIDAISQDFSYINSNIHINEVLKIDEKHPIEISSKTVKAGDDLANINVVYKRTAVLKQDIILSSGVFNLKAINSGAIGYWAGNFTEEIRNYSSSRFSGLSNELWCFFGENQFKKNHSVCFGVDNSGAYLTTGQYRPDFVTNYSVAPFRQYIDMPMFDEKGTVNFKELKVSYNFVKWTKNGIKIYVSIGNCSLGKFDLPFKESGVVELPIIGGTLIIKQSEDLKNAIVTLK